MQFVNSGNLGRHLKRCTGPPQEAADAAGGWRSVKDALGRMYYANDETGESAWELPEGETVQPPADEGT